MAGVADEVGDAYALVGVAKQVEVAERLDVFNQSVHALQVVDLVLREALGPAADCGERWVGWREFREETLELLPGVGGDCGVWVRG